MKETVMPLHGLNQKLKRLKQGVTIYLVHAFPLNETNEHHPNATGWIDKLVITKRPQTKKWFDPFAWTYPKIDYLVFKKDGSSYESHGSLQDMGLISNDYNSHRTFFSERKAKAYLKLVKSGCNI